MKPVVPDVLGELAALILRNAHPDVSPSDRASALGLTAALLGLAAESWDGRVQHLVQENRAVWALLSEGSSLLGTAGPGHPANETDLRISGLELENARLRQALIDLQARLEITGGADARALNAQIWAELTQSTQRRLTASSPV